MGGSNSKVVDNITGAGRRQVAASSAVAERRFVTMVMSVVSLQFIET